MCITTHIAWRFKCHLVLALLAVWLFGLTSSAQESIACNGEHVLPDSTLRCVTQLIEGLPKGDPIAKPILTEPVLGYLQKLTETHGYSGSEDDLNILKDYSLALKSDPIGNRAAIAVLDSAIAYHINEMVPSLSTQALAKASSPGTDIYPAYIKQKLAYLNSERATFYDRGPYELTRRYLLASALESQYFVDRRAGHADLDMVRKELKVLDEILHRLNNSAEYGYIPVRSQTSSLNSDQFWRASLLFLLGQRSELKETLRDLAIRNQLFGLDTPSRGHVYIFRVFHLPQRMTVLKNLDKRGIPTVDIDDSNLLNRYYNPAQLALYACAHIAEPRPERISNFIRAINELVLSDYYVVVSASDSNIRVEDFRQAIRAAIRSSEMTNQLQKLVQDVASREVAGFSDTIKQGARQCDVGDSVRESIYSPFISFLDFQPPVQRVDAQVLDGNSKQSGAKGATVQLLFGGRLNATQANMLSEFLNNSVFPSLHLGTSKGQAPTSARAFTARMRIE
jgi:hypothetical protein